MQTKRLILWLPTLLLAACAITPVPSVNTGVPSAMKAEATSKAAATVDMGAKTNNRFVLNLRRPKSPFHVMGDLGQHRWVVSDIVKYHVVLKKQIGPDTFTDAGALSTDVNLTDWELNTVAEITNVPWGSSYRAFVTTYGRRNGPQGSDTLSQMDTLNAANQYADFTFLQISQSPITVTKYLQVVLDSFEFNGHATVEFDIPASGVYTDPSATPSASAIGNVT